MTQPYKVCPQCGQPAVLEMPQCRRCGFFYPSVDSLPPQGPAGYPPPAYPYPQAGAERPREGRATRRRGTYLIPLLAGLVVMAAIAAGLYRRATSFTTDRASLPSIPVAPRRATGSGAWPAFPANGTFIPLSKPMTASGAPPAGLPAVPQQGNSFFIEQPSRQETPTLYITNLERSTMLLRLWDAYGHSYETSSTNGQTAVLQVPAGDYKVQIWDSNPRVHPNYGDAAFHRFKAYRAQFYYSQDAEPFHLGDD